MDWKEPPDLAEFASTFDLYVKDIMDIKDKDGYIYSHKLKGSIDVFIDDDDCDDKYQILGLDLEQLMGCGCSSGITIRIKKVQQ